MRKGILGSVAALTAGAGLAFGQPMVGPGGPGMMGPGGPGMMPPGMGPGMMGPGGPGIVGPGGNPVIPPSGLEGMVPPQFPGMGQEGGGGAFGSGEGIFGGGGGAPAWWVNADFLLWTPRSMPNRLPFVTTGSPLGGFGVPGNPNTNTVFSDSNISFGAASGMRAFVGTFVDDDARYGYELGGFFLEGQRTRYAVESAGNGQPLLAVPFFNPDTGSYAVFPIANPAGILPVRSGGVAVETASRVWGAEGNLVYNIYRSEGGASIDSIMGLRYFSLKEGLTVATRSTGDTPTFAGAAIGGTQTVTTFDQIRVNNHFYGGNFGFKAEVPVGSWVIGFTGKVAVGYTQHRFESSGSSTLQTAAGRPTAIGGLYIVGDEIGSRREDSFSIIPEGNLNLAYAVTQRLTARVGYSFLWANNMARPTHTLTDTVNPNFVPRSATFGNPPVNVQSRDYGRTTDYVLQGFNFGIEYKY